MIKIIKLINFNCYFFTKTWELRKLSNCFAKIRNAFVGTASPYYVNKKTGHFYLESNNVKNGKINYKKEVFINDFFFQKQKDKWLHTGDLVMVQSGDVGNSAVINESLNNTAAHALIMFQQPKKNVTPYYINYYFQTSLVKKKIDLITVGNTIKHILASDMNKFQISITKMDEQEKISSILRFIDKSITLQQEQLDLYKKLKKGLLQKLFPKDGEKIPEVRFVDFTGNWEKHKLEEVSNRYDNLRIPITASDRIPGNTPYYGANGIQDYVKGYTHDGEFILIAEDGANDLNNYPVQYLNGKAWINNHAYVLQSKDNISDNRFLMNAVKRINIAPFLVGGGRAKLNADTMMKIKITMPNEKEQKEIGCVFQSLEQSIKLQRDKIKEINLLKKYFLQKLFI